jgi:hypothetical protein
MDHRTIGDILYPSFHLLFILMPSAAHHRFDHFRKIPEQSPKPWDETETGTILQTMGGYRRSCSTGCYPGIDVDDRGLHSMYSCLFLRDEPAFH